MAQGLLRVISNGTSLSAHMLSTVYYNYQGLVGISCHRLAHLAN
jgi:hypothetical protein